MKKLSKEIISLIQHIKLNESGWWEKVAKQIIISIYISKDNDPQDFNELYNHIKNDLRLKFDQNRLEKQFNILTEQKILIEKNKPKFHLSKTQFSKCKTDISKDDNLELEVKKFFIKLSNHYSNELNSHQLWEDVKNDLLNPLIKDIGIRTFEIINHTQKLDLLQNTSVKNFLNKYSNQKKEISKILLEFFNLDNKNVKKIILNHLNAYLFAEATNLSEETIIKIYDLSNCQTNIRAFVDTNFLLSLLDLHDNPSNDASESLINLLYEIKNKVDVKFYVFPITIEEFQNLLINVKWSLNRLKPTLEYAKSICNDENFSGVLKKYFQKCLESNTIINIDEYFEPYLHNFTVYLRSKNIEIFNEDLSKYSIEQYVIDDLHDQVDFRFNKIPEKEKKQLTKDEIEYKKQHIWNNFKHDCILWHAIKDKRPQFIDSPKDIKNWLIF